MDSNRKRTEIGAPGWRSWFHRRRTRFQGIGLSGSPTLRGGGFAVLAAFAFGVTTPLIQRLGRGIGPAPSAALLYAGAALASGNPLHGRATGKEARVRSVHVVRLIVTALFGAVAAPMCLTWGLQHTDGAGASLLLNVEAVFTVLFAWMLYRESIGPRVALGLTAMVAGGACLVLDGSRAAGFGWGAIAVVFATLGWALDSTLSRPLADLSPTEVVRWKGMFGMVFGVALSLAFSSPFPGIAASLGLIACGATGYGLSLRLYLLAQRHIGAARTGSVFALAPFVGAATACMMGDRSANEWTGIAAVLFATGVALQLTEGHRHSHRHELTEHEHLHRHDDGHHLHDDSAVDAHSHVHRHEPHEHEHPHAPDLHHGHGHGE
jgi:drug/metabolite transporter (DMT)-like permease